MTKHTKEGLPTGDELSVLLAGVTPDDDHTALLAALHGAYPNLRWRAVLPAMPESYSTDRALVTTAGVRAVDSRKAWIREQIATAGGSWRPVWRTLCGRTDLLAVERRFNPVYVVARTGPAPQDYVQVALDVQTEHVVGTVTTQRMPYGEDEFLHDLGNLPTGVSGGVIGRPSYRLSRVDHVPALLEEIDRLEYEERLAQAPEMQRKTIRIVEIDGTRSRQYDKPFLEECPGWINELPKLVRWFEDWRDSSAHEHDITRHWGIEVVDRMSNGKRILGGTPRWIGDANLPSLSIPDGVADPRKLRRLATDAAAFDRALGYPMAWFFHSAYGNRSTPDAIRRMLDALDSKYVTLPDRDAEVMKRWVQRPYAF